MLNGYDLTALLACLGFILPQKDIIVNWSIQCWLYASLCACCSCLKLPKRDVLLDVTVAGIFVWICAL